MIAIISKFQIGDYNASKYKMSSVFSESFFND